ncbi:hypothetical protein NIES267_00720 [Calothrix parasitica NIES-267]|uniref:Uncharacterized protein n=1 Tax=Calothrix parasitica NIES-267 TaxID=1973488 RepID=A0A1Z4LHA8_9CYAN|nr:hypothetical protein NIES267_00720 [Calothrix parasitica NIES-267]
MAEKPQISNFLLLTFYFLLPRSGTSNLVYPFSTYAQSPFSDYQSNSLRPSKALAKVTSSAYSKSPPTGRPKAILVTLVNGLIN